jgi:hypothetical protein
MTNHDRFESGLPFPNDLVFCGYAAPVRIEGKLDFFHAGPDSSPEAPRRVGAPGGDGGLMSIAGRRAGNRTNLVILDARNLRAGPVATIGFPRCVHEGFHGVWMGAQGRR